MSIIPALFLSLVSICMIADPFAHGTIIPSKIGPRNNAPAVGVPFRVAEGVVLENSMRMAPSPEFAPPEPTRSPLFPILSSAPGFIRSAGVGVSVQIGVTATFSFSITVRGILATDLVQNDEPFRDALPPQLIIPFVMLTGAYEGGLNIPFLELLGANLNTNVTTADQEIIAAAVPEFDELASGAKQVLESQPITAVRISGSASVTGTSFVPRTVFAFVRAAMVQLTNGAFVQIISASAGDVEFASLDGTGALGNSSVVEDFKVEVETL